MLFVVVSNASITLTHSFGLLILSFFFFFGSMPLSRFRSPPHLPTQFVCTSVDTSCVMKRLQANFRLCRRFLHEITTLSVCVSFCFSTNFFVVFFFLVRSRRIFAVLSLVYAFLVFLFLSLNHSFVPPSGR